MLTADANTVAEDTVATGNVLDNDSDVESTLSVASFTVAGVTGSFTAGQVATIAGVGTVTIASQRRLQLHPGSELERRGAASHVHHQHRLDQHPGPQRYPGRRRERADRRCQHRRRRHHCHRQRADNDSDVESTLSVASFTVAGVTGSFSAGQVATIAGVGTVTIASQRRLQLHPGSELERRGAASHATPPTPVRPAPWTSSVTPVDDASVLTADANTVAEDTVATGNVLDNDSDVESTLSVASFTVAGVTGSFTAGQVATIAGVGTVTIASNGDYSFTPAANWNGTAPQISYTTNTGSTSTLDITVNAGQRRTDRQYHLGQR